MVIFRALLLSPATSDLSGSASAPFTVGPDAGNHVVEATFAANPGPPADLCASSPGKDSGRRPLIFSALVLNDAGEPVQGAACLLRVDGECLGTRFSPIVRVSLVLKLIAGSGPSYPDRRWWCGHARPWPCLARRQLPYLALRRSFHRTGSGEPFAWTGSSHHTRSSRPGSSMMVPSSVASTLTMRDVDGLTITVPADAVSYADGSTSGVPGNPVQA